MKEYIELIKNIYENGELSSDRTGTGTRRIFGGMMKFDCSETLPLVTVKYTHYPAVIHELLWFISGSSNIEYLKNNNVRIWNEWADDRGNIGPMYGSQWRHAGATRKGSYDFVGGVDQLAKVIEDIKVRPDSRRIIIDCWDPLYLPVDGVSPVENVGIGKMALAPCHMFMQFFVSKERRLDLIMYQRSVDSFLGLPFNIASYAILLKLIAQVTGTTPGVFTWMGGDIHIYSNHVSQVEEMLSREPKPLPTLEINPEITNIDEFQYNDFIVHNYEYHPALKGEISV